MVEPSLLAFLPTRTVVQGMMFRLLFLSSLDMSVPEPPRPGRMQGIFDTARASPARTENPLPLPWIRQDPCRHRHGHGPALRLQCAENALYPSCRRAPAGRVLMGRSPETMSAAGPLQEDSMSSQSPSAMSWLPLPFRSACILTPPVPSPGAVFRHHHGDIMAWPGCPVGP